MWHIRYPFSDGRSPTRRQPMHGMHIATTRPETMLADGALMVHPEDERYRQLIGKLRRPAALRPARSRSSPTTSSTASSAPASSRYTGAHDCNDYACALRHGIR